MMSDRRNAQSGRAVLFLLVFLILGALAWWWWKNGAAVLPPADDPPAGEEEPPADDPVEDPAEPDAPPALTDADGAVFSYLPVGELLPNSGPGLADDTVYRTDIAFPAEDPVYLNSQVYRFGGGQGAVNGMNGAQCDARNYEYPWQDTFCEKRDRNQPLCPGGGHEGLDIRPHACTKDAHWAIAVEDARVIDIRRHWVTLQTDDGTIYNYLHLNMSGLSVTEGQHVMKGDRIGKISNDFFKSDGTSVPTTTHLHFEMYENYVAEPGDEPLFTKVNPYMTLVAAYARKLGGDE
ncbi:MAG TPA: M23 family peptidase [Parvularcula sp.]|nr:M23 family peptidase [Parvularcula sp.]HBS34980.1 M23 family peptidase [Parvularcula sp.]